MRSSDLLRRSVFGRRSVCGELWASINLDVSAC